MDSRDYKKKVGEITLQKSVSEFYGHGCKPNADDASINTR